ncbi:uncharacterized protein LOC132542692 [Erinaceus europaeus]|uniref:Uncharacterized protein LOC132542692 n=1 Tax=Erinaceus europaeus TaxID=9365 RepID=A0ABM3YJX9_ERIEU|nr:uncharacterized protein LOC132542692 [Erinaceus europaeus]
MTLKEVETMRALGNWCTMPENTQVYGCFNSVEVSGPGTLHFDKLQEFTSIPVKCHIAALSLTFSKGPALLGVQVAAAGEPERTVAALGRVVRVGPETRGSGADTPAAGESSGRCVCNRRQDTGRWSCGPGLHQEELLGLGTDVWGRGCVCQCQCRRLEFNQDGGSPPRPPAGRLSSPGRVGAPVAAQAGARSRRPRRQAPRRLVPGPPTWVSTPRRSQRFGPAGGDSSWAPWKTPRAAGGRRDGSGVRAWGRRTGTGSDSRPGSRGRAALPPALSSLTAQPPLLLPLLLQNTRGQREQKYNAAAPRRPGPV